VLRQIFELERKLPATLAFDHPTIAAIATYLEQVLAGRAPATPEPGEDAPATSALSDLSEDEVEAALLDKLAEIER